MQNRWLRKSDDIRENGFCRASRGSRSNGYLSLWKKKYIQKCEEIIMTKKSSCTLAPSQQVFYTSGMLGQALFNYLFAKSHKMENFIIRIEDY